MSSSKYLKVIFILFSGCTITIGQIVSRTDSTKSNSTIDQSDSLKMVIDSLGHRLDELEKRLKEQATLDSLLTGFEEVEDTFLIPEDQRSRRKQLDALLQLISQRPGNCFLTVR